MDAPTDESLISAPLYPLFIKLDGVRVVVIGAGKVAVRKVETLLEFGASLTVIAPEAEERIIDLADKGRVNYLRRAYVEGDLEGALLAVVATSDRTVNESVATEARKRAMLVNVVDALDLCNCVVPSSLRRGRLQVAVSTGGASPSAARELRLELEERLPDWWEAYLDFAAEARQLIKERIPDSAPARESMMKMIGSSAFRKRFAADERPTAEEAFAELSEIGIEAL